VSDAAADEFTVSGFNLFRFFDTINDPATSDPVLTATALNNRLGKTAEAICSYLKTPDIIGVVEVENIGVLTQLADTINNGQVPTGNAVPACNTAPQYEAYLVEGNDVGGIDVGFLISKKIVDGGATPRVEVIEVVQENDGEVFTNPDSSTSTLNDRPTLRLKAVVHHANGNSYPVTVMINHLRSLGGVNDTAAGSNGWPTEGHRVRMKRLKQAESLAKLVNARQIADPDEKIILLGDFNAFEFSDGFVDSMGIITGQEVPASEVTLHSGFVVETPLTNLTTVDDADQRYSFSFDGNAQSLDHAVVNETVLMNDGVRGEHARINSDFAVINYGLYGAAPIRVSDHDPVVLFVKPDSFGDIDLSVAVSNPDSNVNAGNSTTYTVDINNLDETLTATNAVVSLV
ncbi:MAG: endonuclease/exonuclease/phosphatase family protein, partial [Arenimonas sp.]